MTKVSEQLVKVVTGVMYSCSNVTMSHRHAVAAAL